MALKHETSSGSDNSASEVQGDTKVTNTPPSKSTLDKCAKLTVLDSKKKEVTFKNLCQKTGSRRTLVVFIRHFFCGNCQEYIRTLSRALPPSMLSSLPVPTTLLIIGCGTPDLIPMYARETACPYAIYADPNRKLYSALGMIRSLSLGSKNPDYMSQSVPKLAAKSMVQELKSGRNMLSGGDMMQNGGEFLLALDSDEGLTATWCHRMKNTRDHAEMKEVMTQLGCP